MINVFSTYVEVILKHGGQKGDKASILHVCGGDPTPWNNLVFGTLYSPRMWRWSWIDVLFLVVFLVFSTYVEVILVVGFWIHVKRRILHVCGGDPAIGRELGLSPKYSPRMWRWSLSFLINNSQPSVFSTYVEVILLRPVGTRSIWCILHVCGGDPTKSRYYFNPWSILHTCEGDPNWFSGCSYGLRYSPHMLNLLLSWNVQKNSW